MNNAQIKGIDAEIDEFSDAAGAAGDLVTVAVCWAATRGFDALPARIAEMDGWNETHAHKLESLNLDYDQDRARAQVTEWISDWLGGVSQ